MPAFHWTTDVEEAKLEQRSLKDLINLNTTLPESLEFNRGMAIGVSYVKSENIAVAVGVEFDSTGWYSKRDTKASMQVDFPYKPGLFAFRVGPVICKLLDDVIKEIDLLFFIGQGIAHNRGVGLASHIGVLYNKPSIGATRKSLYGNYVEPAKGRFNSSYLTHPINGKVIGYSVSLGEDCEPFFISPGHNISTHDALTIVNNISGEDTCFPRPLRRAHAIANSEARSIDE